MYVYICVCVVVYMYLYMYVPTYLSKHIFKIYYLNPYV